MIDLSVKMGKNVRIGPYTVIKGDVEIGDNTYIAPHVCIGYQPEHSTDKYELNPKPSGPIRIGSDVVIREFTQINSPIKSVTSIADRCYIMGHCYIAHDCKLDENVILSNGVLLGGWIQVMRGANLGMGAVVHQFTTIGHYAMIAANATVVKDVAPFTKFIPNKPLAQNTYAIDKFHLDATDKKYLEEWNERRFKEREVYS